MESAITSDRRRYSNRRKTYEGRIATPDSGFHGQCHKIGLGWTSFKRTGNRVLHHGWRDETRSATSGHRRDKRDWLAGRRKDARAPGNHFAGLHNPVRIAKNR